MSYKAEVKVVGDSKFYDNAIRFASWGEAHDYGLDLGNRWIAVAEMRVAEFDDPVTNRWIDGRMEDLEPVRDPDGMDWSQVEERS